MVVFFYFLVFLIWIRVLFFNTLYKLQNLSFQYAWWSIWIASHIGTVLYFIQLTCTNNLWTSDLVPEHSAQTEAPVIQA